MNIEKMEKPRWSWGLLLVLTLVVILCAAAYFVFASIAPAGDEIVSARTLTTHPQRYAYEHIRVTGILEFGHNIPIEVGGYECVDGRIYYLKEGRYEIEVYVLGQKLLRTGRRTISGIWVKEPGEDYYRLEADLEHE